MFKNMATFLAVNEPINADYLIVEGWLGKQELSQAYQAFNDGAYQYVIISGGPINDNFNFNLDVSNHAERAARYLLAIGLDEKKMAIVPAPYSARYRTFLGALMVRDWFSGESIVVESLDVFSGDVHSRRTRDLYQLAFGEQVNIGIYASEPKDFRLSQWWKSSNAAKSVATEAIGWLMVKCCFNPGEPRSHYEK